jgi:hypothetical protein
LGAVLVHGLAVWSEQDAPLVVQMLGYSVGVRSPDQRDWASPLQYRSAVIEPHDVLAVGREHVGDDAGYERAEALRRRSVRKRAASLTVQVGIAVLRSAFDRWVNRSGRRAFRA